MNYAFSSDSPLAAICAAPDDDDLRLIYADWLEEQGDHDHAAYIRLALSEKPTQISRHSKYERILLQRAKCLVGRKCLVSFERGLVARLDYRSGDLAQMMEALSRHGLLARLDVLRIGGRLSTAALLAICNSTTLHWTDKLFVGDYGAKLPNEVGLALGGSPYTENLRGLGLIGNDLGRSFMQHLLLSPNLGSLELLDLQVGQAVGRAVRELATVAGLPNLRSLHLHGTHRRNSISNEFSMLVRSSRMAQLRELFLLRWYDFDLLLSQLGASPHFQLERLLLMGEDLSASSVVDLANAPRCRSLKHLELHVTLNPAEQRTALLALLQSPILTQLETITIPLQDDHVAELRSIVPPRSLRALKSSGNNLREGSNQQIAAWLALHNPRQAT